jgi:hypothetical protein
MKFSLNWSLCIYAVALAGCGGSQPPIGAPGATTQATAIALQAERGRSWMLPDAHGRNLLYVGLGEESLDVYTYPGGHLIGSLGVGGGYLCSDPAGNIFVPGAPLATQVLVYAHGFAQPKATLNAAPYTLESCSVDPSSERLAVTTYYSNNIVVFPHNPRRGWRFAKFLSDADMQIISFCAYDTDGDLFVDGQDSSRNFMLAELPNGSDMFSTISLDQSISAAGSMQWDGKYLAIADLGNSSGSASVIYRFALSGSSGKRVSTTKLDLSYSRAQFWIQGGTVIGPITYESVRQIGLWRFPRGGHPFRSFSDEAPTGETVSLK